MRPWTSKWPILKIWPPRWGAKKGVMPYLEKCEALGYSSDLCSYTRIGLGYIESFDSDILNLPRPDMICNCTNICGLCVKWF